MNWNCPIICKTLSGHRDPSYSRVISPAEATTRQASTRRSEGGRNEMSCEKKRWGRILSSAVSSDSSPAAERYPFASSHALVVLRHLNSIERYLSTLCIRQTVLIMYTMIKSLGCSRQDFSLSSTGFPDLQSIVAYCNPRAGEETMHLEIEDRPVHTI